jgi:hypothetical protein
MNVRYLPSSDELEVPSFSEWDDAIMQDIFGKRLWKAAQNLLHTQSQLERTAGSFGLDPEKALALIREDLKKFREAAIDQWRDQ